ARRAAAQARADLLIPIVKGWCTEKGNEVASLGVQVHGGMGFIEETGAAQYLRDARITTIYEGTTGIQSNDLLGRKVARDHGAAMTELTDDMLQQLRQLDVSHPSVKESLQAALEGVQLLQDCTAALLQAHGERPDAAMAVSVPYLMLCGYVMGGWLLAWSAAVAAGRLDTPERTFYEAKIHTARFFSEQVLPRALGLARTVRTGAASVIETDAALI
ncbi:MAG: acyl-CoA dehydrogenase, partial [Sinobacteraceae bacterium]|nr:acyl-CoA dehydrogenase [Nevskiaceae bacterium]